MKVNIDLMVESITNFYDRVAEAIGVDSSTVKYDCRKILVSKERFDVISNYYDSPDSFGMAWVCFGPKTLGSLVDDEVEIEEGFICE